MKKVTKHLGICMLLISSLFVLFVSCMTYTYDDAKSAISSESSIPKTPPISTKFVSSEKQVTPVESMVPESVKVEAADRSTIRLVEAALVPLPCTGPQELLDLIIAEVHDSSYDVIAFTGTSESLMYVKDSLRIPQYWTEDGLLLATHLPVEQESSLFFSISMENGQKFRVAIVDLQSSTLFQSLRSASTTELWQDLIFSAHVQRRQLVESLLMYQDEVPLLVLASLGEPSAIDWFETADNHPYRIRLPWPLIENFKENHFLDSWQSTHYSAAQSPGVTWEFIDEKESYSERVDFLLTKGLIPLRTTTITIGPWNQKKLPYEQRSALTGTFIIP